MIRPVFLRNRLYAVEVSTTNFRVPVDLLTPCLISRPENAIGRPRRD